MPNKYYKTFKIVQSTFTESDREVLLSIWGDLERERIFAYPYHFTVFTTGQENHVIVKISSTRPISIGETELFETLMNNVDINDLWQLVFLSTVFHSEKYRQLLENNRHLGRDIAKIFNPFSSILNITFGYLTFGFQLEFGYRMLTGKTAAEAKSFRIDWNLKRPFAIREASMLKVNEEMTLYDFISMHNPDPSGFVYEPALAEGFQLWKLLHQ